MIISCNALKTKFLRGRKGRMDPVSRSGWHHHINTISLFVVGNDDIKKNGLIPSLFISVMFQNAMGRFWLETDYCLS